MRYPALTMFVFLALCIRLAAEDRKPIEVTLHARAIETPVLKYRLFPAEAEIQPGDAAPILLRLPWEQTQWMSTVYPTLHEWQSRPLNAPEWKSVGGVLPENFYEDIKRAAFRRHATWEYPIHETSTPYLIRLPDVQGLRNFIGHGLAARIRYHLTRGELDRAREGILVGFANGRHLAQTPFYVNQLVAVAIHRSMLHCTGELISQPESANLYWALSSLPDSLVELDRAASLEASVFSMTLPAINDLDRPRDAAEWTKMASQLVALLQELGEMPRQENAKNEGSLVGQILQRLNPLVKSPLTPLVEDARKELPELLHISNEKVASMSDDEAAVRWYMHKRLEADQSMSAVLVLPPREALPELKLLKEEVRSLHEKTGGKGYDIFDPVSIYVSAWTVRREINALRIIEAVRHYGATHNGMLPKSLHEITDLPIPLDPLTGQPFEWTVNGAAATLKSPPLPSDVVEAGSATERNSTLEYRLKLQ